MKALRMAHHGPIAGHFGRDRTLQAIQVRLDWPGIVKDVNELSASCPICQKNGPAILSKAPLQLLPIIKDPFSRVAMDVFGPSTLALEFCFPSGTRAPRWCLLLERYCMHVLEAEEHTRMCPSPFSHCTQ